MKKILSLTAALLLAAASAATAANIVLPEPDKTGGPSVMEAIANRASAEQRDFSKEELSLKELSTCLLYTSARRRTGR